MRNTLLALVLSLGLVLAAAATTAAERDDVLNEDEVIAMAVLILIAGHETTVNLIGTGIRELLRHPEQLALVREQVVAAAAALETEDPAEAAKAWFDQMAEAAEQAGTALQAQLLADLANSRKDP